MSEHKWQITGTEPWHDGSASYTTIERCEHCGLEVKTGVPLPASLSFLAMTDNWLTKRREQIRKLRAERPIVRGDANDTVELAADPCPQAPRPRRRSRLGPHGGHWERQDYHDERAFEPQLEEMLNDEVVDFRI